jgi:hypothetical protein
MQKNYLVYVVVPVEQRRILFLTKTDRVPSFHLSINVGSLANFEVGKRVPRNGERYNFS